MTQKISLSNVSHQLFKPHKKFVLNANINIQQSNKLRDNALKSYTKFWAELALKYIIWHKKFTRILNVQEAPFVKWFEDGKLNISYNCLDKHLPHSAHKTAIIFESDSGHVETITYKELHAKVCKLANGLLELGVIALDRVIIYLPHSIEAIVAMQACARIGAIHCVVFGGFSANALGLRITDTAATVILTADNYMRGGKLIHLKNQVDEAVKIIGKLNTIQHVIVHAKNGGQISWNNTRDIWWHDVVQNKSDICKPKFFGSEHPLFILYTSGSTGTPKGIQHSSAGYLLGAILSMLWVFDIKSNDVYWCTADVGWITGHTYVCYGPLALGLTQVIFDGVPTYPAPSRFWEIIERYKVSIFYTAPTAIRTLIKHDAQLPNKFNLSSLRLLGSVGEPISPETWLWYYTVVGKKKCPIVDTWWQTETGSIMLAPLPGITALKAGSCTLPLPGIMADIVDESGNILENDNTGYLVIKQPFPSQIRNIWQNKDRYVKSYYPEELGQGKYYVVGDLAYKDKDGYFWILGRTDDVLNVSGHRLSTAEIEAVLVQHPAIAEAAVVGKPHVIKGEAICAFVVCKGSYNITDVNIMKQLEQELREWVAKAIGAIAKPDEIHFGDNLPKTRSGKIMRRLLRSIVTNDNVKQDVSTLENPASLEYFNLKNKTQK